MMGRIESIQTLFRVAGVVAVALACIFAMFLLIIYEPNATATFTEKEIRERYTYLEELLINLTDIQEASSDLYYDLTVFRAAPVNMTAQNYADLLDQWAEENGWIIAHWGPSRRIYIHEEIRQNTHIGKYRLFDKNRLVGIAFGKCNVIVFVEGRSHHVGSRLLYETLSFPCEQE